MKKKEEVKYLDREWQEMAMRLANFLKTGDQEELHKFRVQIKKLRALFILFGDTSNQPGLLKGFKPVRRIFKYAGNIRDAHTNLQLSRVYDIKNEAFEAGQQKIIAEGTTEFQSNGKKFIKTINDAYKLLKKQLPAVQNSSIAGYYKKQLQEIATNLAVSGFTEDMHTNRKLIKILVYNYKLVEKAVNDSLSFNKEYLDKLQEAIGKWHDNVIAAQLFSSPELNDKPVVTKINRKNAGIKRKITALAEDFMKKATTVEVLPEKNQIKLAANGQ
jgi:CHAD domain-containing protein